MLEKIFSKAAVPVVLMGFLLVGRATPAPAYSNCDQKIRKAERNLEKAIRRYGLHSAEAERRRDQLETVRARCQQHP